jgi:hypothetical protein
MFVGLHGIDIQLAFMLCLGIMLGLVLCIFLDLDGFTRPMNVCAARIAHQSYVLLCVVGHLSEVT